MSGVDIAGLVEELRSLADCDARAGEPLGKCMRRAADALLAQAAELAEARALIDRLRLEAQIHAGEARCHKATVHEAYQVCSGATGEPGNWHGAEPIRKALTEATRQRDEALAALKASEEREARLREALKPLSDRIDEIEQVKAVAKFATEGTAAVKLSLLRDARSALAGTLADATNNPPSDPGTEQREAGR